MDVCPLQITSADSEHSCQIYKTAPLFCEWCPKASDTFSESVDTLSQALEETLSQGRGDTEPDPPVSAAPPTANMTVRIVRYNNARVVGAVVVGVTKGARQRRHEYAVPIIRPDHGAREWWFGTPPISSPAAEYRQSCVLIHAPPQYRTEASFPESPPPSSVDTRWLSPEIGVCIRFAADGAPKAFRDALRELAAPFPAAQSSSSDSPRAPPALTSTYADAGLPRPVLRTAVTGFAPPPPVLSEN